MSGFNKPKQTLYDIIEFCEGDFAARRACWTHDRYIKCIDDSFLTQDDERLLSLSKEDFCATDWILVTEFEDTTIPP
jgi:hypothetical protein